MSDDYAPGEQHRIIFDEPRAAQLTRLSEQVGRLTTTPGTSDEALDIALSEIEFTIHVIRERLWYDEEQRIRATAGPPHKSVATSSLEDII